MSSDGSTNSLRNVDRACHRHSPFRLKMRLRCIRVCRLAVPGSRGLGGCLGGKGQGRLVKPDSSG